MSITTKAQESFTNLRKRLDQLGYQQPLGIESLPLVERLFADLLHTTESLRSMKVENGKKKKEDSTTSDIAIESYRSDNGKLVKENNELHQKLIRQKDEFELTIKDMRCTLRKLEHENADLKFLNNQYVAKIRCLEKDSRQKSDCILKLQEKNLHAVVQTPGGRKKSIPFRRQRMELDSTVPPSNTSDSGSCTCHGQHQADDPYVADMLKVADDSIALLCRQVHDLTNEKQGAEGKVKSLRKQIMKLKASALEKADGCQCYSECHPHTVSLTNACACALDRKRPDKAPWVDYY
ncbi:hypothetical protein NP493_341g00002 [Ridgeia piscesae]|uniref:Uncharacterized protein n=1 Tax=Ridgeia piscesae TaxID=27915 RepID=A0AAD9NUB2_RIDPI|nr:hypothetical protein NP493_341g00002 [Ridgeia piscesae]